MNMFEKCGVKQHLHTFRDSCGAKFWNICNFIADVFWLAEELLTSRTKSGLYSNVKTEVGEVTWELKVHRKGLCSEATRLETHLRALRYERAMTELSRDVKTQQLSE